MCTDPGEGWTNNDKDCDDNFLGYAVGDECFTGTGCSTILSPSCYCAFFDGDKDGVCDGIDVCPEEDDKIDIDLNGVPDCSEEPCIEAYDDFGQNYLRTWPS